MLFSVVKYRCGRAASAIPCGLFMVLACLATPPLALPQAAGKTVKGSDQGVTRVYYIAADEVMWNYAPKGRNLTGTPSQENEGAATSTTFRKAVYHQYVDASFSVLTQRPAEWEHLGILGPLIQAEHRACGSRIRHFAGSSCCIRSTGLLKATFPC